MKKLENIGQKIYFKLRLGKMLSSVERTFWKPYMVMDAKQTIDYIVKTNCSVARFGDGEFSIVAYGCSLGFQRADKQLKKSLIEVMHYQGAELLLCLPSWAGWPNLNDVEKLRTLGPIHQHGIENNLYDWIKYFSRNRVYGDANISRVTDTTNFESRMEQINYTKKIWNGREVILVEGSKTCFGVGNDLLDNAISVSRIIGPAESGFDCIEELVNACEKECEKHQNSLVLLAFGPTATVMAWRLQCKGIQAVDIGHLDIVYEVAIHNALNGEDAQTIPVPRKYAVPGKYTNEAIDGNLVEECNDVQYLQQVVYKCTKL